MRARSFRSTWVAIAPVVLVLGCGAQAPDQTSEVAEGLQVCPNGPTVEGIDVSYYQGAIDWNQVESSGIAFAVTRISDGLNFPDSDFDRNWPAIKSVGLVRGAYQYFEPGQDALAQADKVVQKVGRLGPGDLPVQLDMEVTGGQSSAAIVSKMKAWSDRVTAGTGKAPMVYTARYFWNDNVDSTDFSSYPLWVANYDVSCPNTPDAWTKWLIWQYGDNGTVSGINGGADVDRFNGTREDLERFVGKMPDYAAQYVSQSFPLASSGMTMTAGQTVPAYIELKNVGTKAWDESTRLATSDPRDRVSVFEAPNWFSPTRLAKVSGTVAPGATYKFQFDFQAPATPGTYEEFFGIVQEGVAWFSDPGQGGPPDRQLENKIEVLSASAAGTVVNPPPAPGGSLDAGNADGGGATNVTGASGSTSGGSLSARPLTGGITHAVPDAQPRDAGSWQGATAHAGAENGGCDCRITRRPSTGPHALWILGALRLSRRRPRRLSRRAARLSSVGAIADDLRLVGWAQDHRDDDASRGRAD
jgi:lysozyme